MDSQQDDDEIRWQDRLWNELPLLGHRNWILVVDKAFPLQSAKGIEVVYTNESMDSVLTETLDYLSTQNHIHPIVYTDAELEYLSDKEVPGIVSYKKMLDDQLSEFNVRSILHDTVFTKIDEASKLFKIFVLKTNAVLPYSSVFFELDCGYWDGTMEQKLREKMGALQ
ncbi:hypothetical protein [Membranihabitans maritimus]|uniref:hypothetical protein n=1 Tax=Membranihabitans maritimus TaxID=2904244 RepID=UPI001F3787E8|nr:hypothetical protein [Membranihabitans maritimus]